jgi:hypothetical protein
MGPEAMGTAAKVWHRCRCAKPDGGAPMTQVDDLSRSLITFEQNSTMVVVLEMSQSSWLAAGVIPGIERRPLKKLDPDPTALLRLVEVWRDHAMKVGRMITRIVLAFEAARDGFWLARWLRARSIEPFVIHSTSVAVSREHRRAALGHPIMPRREVARPAFGLLPAHPAATGTQEAPGLDHFGERRYGTSDERTTALRRFCCKNR